MVPHGPTAEPVVSWVSVCARSDRIGIKRVVCEVYRGCGAKVKAVRAARLFMDCGKDGGSLRRLVCLRTRVGRGLAASLVDLLVTTEV